ncbi:MAG TPA: site-specific integrase [Roseiarcus sp.]
MATLAKLEWLVDLVRPALGSKPITEITPRAVLEALQPIEARGRHETANRARATVGAVCRYAVVTSRAELDPTTALRGALARPAAKHRAAIIDSQDFGGLLRSIDGYAGAGETGIALKLLALTFVRPGELRGAEWSELDCEAAIWTVPSARAKMRREHRVPLSRQALGLLSQLHGLTGQGRFLLPSIRSAARCVSENTLNAALRRLGFGQDEMTAHGFRAAASSMLNESGLWQPDAIEAQLAHQERSAVRRAYARSEYWPKRVRMMQWWADRCDELREGRPTKVVSISNARHG